MSPGAAGAAKRDLPGTFEQVAILARWQWRDYLRSRRFFILCGVIAALGLIMTVVVGYYRPPGLLSSPTAFYRELWGGGIAFVVILTGIFLGGDAIAGEFQNKTGYFLMGLPLRRITVFAGKYLAALAASFLVMGVFLVILVANGLFYFGGGAFPWQLAASFGLACFYLLALLGFTFFFSSLFKTSSYATVLTALLFIIGFNVLESVISALVGIEPWMIISYSSGIIGNIFADPYPAHVVTNPGPGGRVFTSYNPTLETGIAIMLGYLVFSAVAGYLSFERKEFT